MLSVKNLTAGYGKKVIINNISFDVPKGQLCAIVGQNGSGKSTLLKAMCGLLKYEGSCKIINGGAKVSAQTDDLGSAGKASATDGKTYPSDLNCKEISALSELQRAKRIGYLSAINENSMPITVMDMVLLGWYPENGAFGRISGNQYDMARKVLERVGMAEYIQQDFAHLSTGQQQLVMLARTLVREPETLMLDEPDSALDFQNKYEIMTLLGEYAHRGNTVLVCSHDINLLLQMADRIILLKDGVKQGELLLKPAAEKWSLGDGVSGSSSAEECSNPADRLSGPADEHNNLADRLSSPTDRETIEKLLSKVYGDIELSEADGYFIRMKGKGPARS